MSTVVDARPISIHGCDTNDCVTYFYDVESGWIMPEDPEVNGRLRGRYGLRFAAGNSVAEISGNYDTAVP